MLLSALDPALLVYEFQDWQAREAHCLDRFESLSLHRGTIKEYGQRMAMSPEFAGLIQECFPWNDYRSIGELRDLARFFYEDLQKAEYIDAQAVKANLQPDGIVCKHIQAQHIVDAWIELLCGCVDEVVLTAFEPQIATWKTASLPQHANLTLSVHDPETETSPQTYHLPLVWDDASWAVQLFTQEWWPDLNRCVELYFKTNSGMRRYPGAREQPLPLECTDTFWKSLDRFCKEESLRRSLVEALTKRACGILDASLGDEQLGKVRRFRVTDFWRVHYYEQGERLVLEEFGPHSIGGVD